MFSSCSGQYKSSCNIWIDTERRRWWWRVFAKTPLSLRGCYARVFFVKVSVVGGVLIRCRCSGRKTISMLLCRPLPGILISLNFCLINKMKSKDKWCYFFETFCLFSYNILIIAFQVLYI